MSSRSARSWELAFALLAPLAAHGQTPSAVPAAPPAATYTEPFRPQYHFTPAVNWMNDPNGMVYYDGEYHLFYQYNPFGAKWGHMSWGHAVSRDLVRWQHLPVAVPEADSVMAFSGSAVVDWQNTSGFGQGGRPPLVAIYTGHRTDRPSQSQYLAYSTDRGRTWTRYAGNPVLDIGSAEFRDPKVMWHEASRRWIMTVVLATEHKVRFYGSPDLKRWTPLSDFGPFAATGGVWECPDLFELPVDGDARNTRWVLVVNINPGGIAGGSAGQYFVGRFDGTRFVADPDGGATPPSKDPAAALWMDYGKDFYAAVTWSDVPRADGRRVLLGWMNNWQYANDIPTAPWRSAMSVPRALALTRTPAGVRLVQRPVRELERLRGAPRQVAARAIPAGSTSLAAQGIRGKAVEIEATFAVDTSAAGTAGAAGTFGLKVRTGNGQETVVGVDARGRQLFVDRSRSGDVGFHQDFTSNRRETAPLPVEDGRVRLRVFVDWSSVEVFAGDGRVAITDQIFPSPESEGVELFATGGSARLLSLTAWPLRSAWTAAAAPAARTSRAGR
jgi:fructan beta-fructosidase